MALIVVNIPVSYTHLNGNDPGIRNTGPDDRADHVGQNAFWRTATACVFIAGRIGTFDRSTGFCRIRQSKRGDDCRVYGGHGLSLIHI